MYRNLEREEQTGTKPETCRNGKGAYGVLVRKPVRKRVLGIPKLKWEDNIKDVLQERAWVVYWIDLALDRDKWRAIVNTVMNFWVPYNMGRLLTR